MKYWLYILTALAAIALVLLVIRNHRPAPAMVSVKTAPAPVVAPKTTSQSAPRISSATLSNLKSNVELSSLVKVILDENASYDARKEAVQDVSGKLSDSDREALYQFLRTHMPEDDRQLGQVLKNDLLNSLCEIQPPPDGLRQLLTDIYQDQGQNEVLRDYAIQHLSAFYRQMSSATAVDANTRDEELQKTRDVLWQALGETGTSIAGTALLGISQLYQQGWSGFEQQKVNDAALALANDKGGNELTQITAFQVCANMNVADALPSVLGAVKQPLTESVQISAIAALGQLGGQAQGPLLIAFIQGPDTRLKLPAQHALDRIQQRLRQTGS